MSRNFRCTVGVAIVWGLFALNIVWGCFVAYELFFGGIAGMKQVGWDMQLIYGIAKVFCSGVGLCLFFWIARVLLDAIDWLYAWRIGHA